jgi:hypothetical protein
VTFSDSRVIELVNSRFVACWESVADVRTATFDLGNGKTVTGTTGGEMAIFFCFPDGTVFDVLPALHSPQAVHAAAAEALREYDHLRTSRNREAEIQAYHQAGLLRLAVHREPPKRQVYRERHERADPATKDLTRMLLSKAGVFLSTESIVVVEPGGLPLYRRKIHELLSTDGPRTPLDLRKPVFETILGEPLTDRGAVTHSWDTPTPFSILEAPLEENP